MTLLVVLIAVTTASIAVVVAGAFLRLAPSGALWPGSLIAIPGLVAPTLAFTARTMGADRLGITMAAAATVLFQAGVGLWLVIDIRRPGHRPPMARLVLAATFAVTGAVLLAGVVHGNFRSPHHHLVLPSVALAAWLSTRTPDLARRTIRSVAAVLLIIVYLSLVASLVLPEAAATPGAEGVRRFTGLGIWDFRVRGLTGHANGLGPVAAAGGILASVLRPKLWRCHVAACAVCLYATESRVSILAFLAGVVVVLAWSSRPRALRQPLRIAAGAVVLMALAAPVWTVATTSRPTATTQSAAADSLTGRTTIWRHALDAFQADPVFGFGPGLWTPAFTDDLVLTWGEQWIREVEQSHNQVVQTLGEAGSVGGAALFAMLGVVALGALVARGSTGGASLALVVFLSAGMAVESVLSGFFVGPSMMALLATLVLCSWWPHHPLVPHERPSTTTGRSADRWPPSANRSLTMEMSS